MISTPAGGRYERGAARRLLLTPAGWRVLPTMSKRSWPCPTRWRGVREPPAAQQPASEQTADPHWGDWRHLREPAQRHHRHFSPVPQERQCGHPARRQEATASNKALAAAVRAGNEAAGCRSIASN